MVIGAVLNALGAAFLVLLGIAAVVAAGSSSAILDELGADLIVPMFLFAAVDGLAAAVGFWAHRALEHARRDARTALTGMLGVNTLAALITALTGYLGLAVATLLYIALGAGWLSLLWLPESSRRFFGDPPRATASLATAAPTTASPGRPATATAPPTDPTAGRAHAPSAAPASGPVSPPHTHQPPPFGPAGQGRQPAPVGRPAGSPGGFPTPPRHSSAQPTEYSGEPVTVSLRAHR